MAATKGVAVKNAGQARHVVVINVATIKATKSSSRRVQPITMCEVCCRQERVFKGSDSGAESCKCKRLRLYKAEVLPPSRAQRRESSQREGKLEPHMSCPGEVTHKGKANTKSLVGTAAARHGRSPVPVLALSRLFCPKTKSPVLQKSCPPVQKLWRYMVVPNRKGRKVVYSKW